MRNELTDPNYPKRRLQYNIYLGKTSFFSHRSGLTRFFCHYGFVGSIEGPIWRTQIRSVNAGEVDFFVFLNNMFRHFSGKLSGWVRLWANFGPKSIKLTWFFSSNAFKCYFFSWNSRRIPPVDDSFQSLREKNMRSWKFDYKNMSLLVIRHMTEQILTFGFPGNVGYRLVSWDSIVSEIFSKIVEYLVTGGGPLLWEVFSQIHFVSGGALSTFLWIKLAHLL